MIKNNKPVLISCILYDIGDTHETLPYFRFQTPVESVVEEIQDLIEEGRIEEPFIAKITCSESLSEEDCEDIEELFNIKFHNSGFFCSNKGEW